jgi:surface polysaccharide O-acyltransferase-like enzyme
MSENNKNNDNPLSAYVIVSHIAFVVAVPLLFFIGGGMWLADRLSLPDWTRITFVLLGIITMIASLISYLYRLIVQYGSDDQKPAFKPDKKERDFYYENDKTT